MLQGWNLCNSAGFLEFVLFSIARNVVVIEYAFYLNFFVDAVCILLA